MAEALILYTNRLFTGNRSQVRRWGRRLGADFAGLAAAWAPVRSGDLKKSIFFSVEGLGKQMDIIVGASADHALFVILGTGQYVGRPRIRNPHGRALPVGRDRAWGPKRLVFNQGEVYTWANTGPYVGRGVSGQAPQNFFKVAHEFLIPLHPATSYIDWDNLPKSF